MIILKFIFNNIMIQSYGSVETRNKFHRHYKLLKNLLKNLTQSKIKQDKKNFF